MVDHRPCKRASANAAACKKNVNASNKLNSFVNKVLRSLHALQGLRRFHSGASVSEIKKYMKSKFVVDGDLGSQIKAALEHLHKIGIVHLRCKKHILVFAAASVQTIAYELKSEEIKRIQKIFVSKWSSDGPAICKPKKSESCSSTKSPDSSENCCKPSDPSDSPSPELSSMTSNCSCSVSEVKKEVDVDQMYRYLKQLQCSNAEKGRKCKKRKKCLCSKSSTEGDESVSDASGTLSDTCQLDRCKYARTAKNI